MNRFINLLKYYQFILILNNYSINRFNLKKLNFRVKIINNFNIYRLNFYLWQNQRLFKYILSMFNKVEVKDDFIHCTNIKTVHFIK